jgi:Ca2+/Na+ antiporter
VSEMNHNTIGKILAFAAVTEAGTGLLLMIVPAVVIRLLLGEEISGALVGRLFGIALIALGLACWPSGQQGESNSPALRAMLFYNLLIALYLTYLGTLGHLMGLLLWPVVALHTVVALLLVLAWHNQRQTKVISNRPF